MNSILKALSLSAIVYCLPVVSGVMLSDSSLSFASKAIAEEVKTEKKRVKVPAVRNRVYKHLARAQKLADEGDKIGGFEVLDGVKDRLDSLNQYEAAMMWNFYGFMHYANEDLSSASDSFEQVVAQEAIPESLRLSTLYSLAQIAMQQQDYKKALTFLEQWQSVNTKELNASQLVLFAQVYYQDKQFEQAVVQVSKAIENYNAKNKIAKENWLILQRASYYELKQPKNVTKVMEELVRLYDKPQYWLQLGSMYAEIGEEDKQLGIMEAAWQAGYIEKQADIITLAQLYLYHDVPYKAADVLNNAIADGKVPAEEKYFELLAQAYMAAKEDDKAIPVLIKASEIAETGKYDAQLAQSYLNTDKWTLAINAANTAIKRAGVMQMGNVYLVLGMAHFNLKEFDQSLSAFSKATDFKPTKKVAVQWKKYVEKEKKNQEQLDLAMLN